MSSVPQPIYIYMLRSLIDRRILYVGQTNNLSRRLSQHIGQAKTSKYPLYRWMRRNNNAIEMIVLQVCANQKNADDAEIMWIANLATHITQRGYNLTLGGKGSRGYTWKLTKTTRKRQSTAAKKRSSTPKSKANTSAHRKAYFSDPANVAKHKAAVLGFNTSDKATNANHVRWHVNRGIVKPGCPHC